MGGRSDTLKLPSEPLVIVVKRRFDAPAERVFDAWLDAKSAGQFLFRTPTGEMKRVEIDGQVGGMFVVAEQRGDVLAEHFGRYVEIDRPRQLVFLFSISGFRDPEEVVSRVSIEITPAGSGCELTLTHQIDPQWIEYRDRTREGWAMILDNLNKLIS
jgi:uncharacterized protein YndB with AHSA1/START domain